MKLTEMELAYYNGYKQGRFDEYADSIGSEQTEKVEAKIDKQKNCPYCHANKEATKEYYKVRPDVAKDGMSFGKIRNSWCNSIGYDGQTYYFCSFGNVYGCPINYCPMCGRPLNKEEE